MAVGKWKSYEFAKKYMLDGTFDLDATTNWKAALFLSTSNCDTLGVGTGVYGDLTNEVANGLGYTTGGVALTGVTLTKTGGVIKFDCDNPLWTATGGSIVARFIVFYQNATLNGIVKPLLCVCLLDTTPGDVTAVSGTTFTLILDPTDGVLQLSGATTN